MHLNRRDAAGEPGAGGAVAHVVHAKDDAGGEKQRDRQQQPLPETDPEDGEGEGRPERSPAA